jgi:hypothetical protein
MDRRTTTWIEKILSDKAETKNKVYNSRKFNIKAQGENKSQKKQN